MKHIKKLSDIDKNMNVDIALEAMFTSLITPTDSKVYQLLVRQYPNIDIASAFREAQERVRTDSECRADVEKILVKYINMFVDDDINNNISLDSLSVDSAKSAINDVFRMVRQGQATNRLTKINARKRDRLKPDPISGALKITYGDFTIEIKNFPKTEGLRTSSHQLLDALMQEATRNGFKSQIVRILVKDFMNMRGLKDEKEARKQINADLETLSNIRISFTENRKGNRGQDFINVSIIGTYGIKKGYIQAVIDLVFFEQVVKNYNVMPYPQTLYTLNGNNNPNSFYFGRKITEHKNMNYFKPNADIISVEKLLKSSPVMPSYDEVSKNGRHYVQQIINPFERDMNALNETLTWEYCHSNGTPLSEQDFDILYGNDKNNPSYNLFMTLLVKITWRNYPERAEQPKPKPKAHKKSKKRETQTTQAQPPIAL